MPADTSIPQVNSPGIRIPDLVIPVPPSFTTNQISPMVIEAIHSPALGGPVSPVTVVGIAVVVVGSVGVGVAVVIVAGGVAVTVVVVGAVLLWVA